jgi:2-keto-4-pentenoate hydratase/2-oxohepta-3-ene-1,7-dioic acid hydratase in catechol pathway
MRLVRYRKQRGGSVQWGWVSEDRVGLVEGDPFGEFRRKDARLSFESVELLPPVVPSKVLCVGRNYAAHAAEHEVEVPELPLLFLKPPSSIIGPGQTVFLPPQSAEVEHEAELAVVIGQTCRWVEPMAAMQVVLGFTVANDVTARDLQRRDGQWTRAKGFDTFCPIGPWVETELDPADSVITCTVNGQLRQMASTRDMIFPVRQIVAFASSVMTLAAGDVILTGTPAGVGPLADGDRVTIDIEGVGVLEHDVRADSHSPVEIQK